MHEVYDNRFLELSEPGTNAFTYTHRKPVSSTGTLKHHQVQPLPTLNPNPVPSVWLVRAEQLPVINEATVETPRLPSHQLTARDFIG